MLYLPTTSSNPPVDWTGEMNRRSAQAVGLVAWYSAQNRPVGMAEYHARYAATVQNAPDRRFHPVLGSGVDLNGTNQRVNSEDIADITGPFTLSIWAILDTLPSSGATRELINKSDSIGGYSLWHVNSSGTHQVGSTTGDSGGGYTTTSVNYTLPTATPFLLAVTFDSANCRYYFNGQQIGTAQANTRNPAAVTKALTIGAFGYYTPSSGDLVPNRWTDGAIFDVRIWKRALSAADILALYDPQTRWELYRPPQPQVWWIPPVTTTSIIPQVRHHMAQQGMA